MPNCWSCTVIVEPGTSVCPFCGADQSRPVEYVSPHIPQPLTLKSVFRDWGLPAGIVVVACVVIAGIYWHNFGLPSVSPSTQATTVAANSLREIRAALSTYALSAKDSYPVALSTLGSRPTLPMQAAQAAGYHLEYAPKPSGESPPRGFTILARPGNETYPNLYIDESGLVRATQESRAATAKDPPL